jgi:hypothetical protein
VLRPHGHLGLIWNRRDLDQPLQAAMERLIAPYRTRASALASDAWRAAFTRSAPFAPVVERHAAHAQTLDADGLVDRVLSISFIVALPDDERRAVEAQVRGLAGDAPVELRYVTELAIYTRRH